MKWNDKPFYSLDYYNKTNFGGKVYKLSIDGGMTCPNRDGTVSTDGCIFCSAGGSGDFAAKNMIYNESLGLYVPDIKTELDNAKKLVESKINPKNFAGYFAYFQSYTNTYAPINYLEHIFYEAINSEGILGISIGTRPDCLSDEIIALLVRLNQIKPVFIELGLQTINDQTAKRINRGYPLSTFEVSLNKLNNAGIPVVVHVILGLPGETTKDMLATTSYLARANIQGIKLHTLHVLKDTELAKDYSACLSMDLHSYAKLIVSIIERLPESIVVHRITGDGPRKTLISPLWTLDKKNVLNTIMKEFATQDTWQGKYYDS